MGAGLIMGFSDRETLRNSTFWGKNRSKRKVPLVANFLSSSYKFQLQENLVLVLSSHSSDRTRTPPVSPVTTGREYRVTILVAECRAKLTSSTAPSTHPSGDQTPSRCASFHRGKKSGFFIDARSCRSFQTPQTAARNGFCNRNLYELTTNVQSWIENRLG